MPPSPPSLIACPSCIQCIPTRPPFTLAQVLGCVFSATSALVKRDAATAAWSLSALLTSAAALFLLHGRRNLHRHAPLRNCLYAVMRLHRAWAIVGMRRCGVQGWVDGSGAEAGGRACLLRAAVAARRLHASPHLALARLTPRCCRVTLAPTLPPLPRGTGGATADRVYFAKVRAELLTVPPLLLLLVAVAPQGWWACCAPRCAAPVLRAPTPLPAPAPPAASGGPGQLEHPAHPAASPGAAAAAGAAGGGAGARAGSLCWRQGLPLCPRPVPASRACRSACGLYPPLVGAPPQRPLDTSCLLFSHHPSTAPWLVRHHRWRWPSSSSGPCPASAPAWRQAACSRPSLAGWRACRAAYQRWSWQRPPAGGWCDLDVVVSRLPSRGSGAGTREPAPPLQLPACLRAGLRCPQASPATGHPPAAPRTPACAHPCAAAAAWHTKPCPALPCFRT